MYALCKMNMFMALALLLDINKEYFSTQFDIYILCLSVCPVEHVSAKTGLNTEKFTIKINLTVYFEKLVM